VYVSSQRLGNRQMMKSIEKNTFGRIE
jgi:hypothetical protein